MGNEASQEAEVHASIENQLEAAWSHVPLDGSIPPREGHKYIILIIIIPLALRCSHTVLRHRTTSCIYLEVVMEIRNIITLSL